jgi:hypothetical protein
MFKKFVILKHPSPETFVSGKNSTRWIFHTCSQMELNHFEGAFPKPQKGEKVMNTKSYSRSPRLLFLREQKRNWLCIVVNQHPIVWDNRWYHKQRASLTLLMFNWMSPLFYLYDTRDRESIMFNLVLPTFLNVCVEDIVGERFVVTDMRVWVVLQYPRQNQSLSWRPVLF